MACIVVRRGDQKDEGIRPRQAQAQVALRTDGTAHDEQSDDANRGDRPSELGVG
jgi:hypothetical protein